jgi:hypothetical protein
MPSEESEQEGQHDVAGLGDYFAAVMRTGNHASIEGHTPPSNHATARLANEYGVW